MIAYLMSNGRNSVIARRVETARAWRKMGYTIIGVYRSGKVLLLADMAEARAA